MAIPVEPLHARHGAEIDALSAWSGHDPALVQAAVGVVWASEVLHATDLAVRDAAAAITAVASAGDSRGHPRRPSHPSM